MSDNRSALLLAVALAALAGWIDAAGFLRLGGLFVSFMSGNSTKIAVQAITGDPGKAAFLAAVVAGFVASAFAGEAAGLGAGRWRKPAVLGAVALLLAMAWWQRAHDTTLTVCLVAAMGAQNATEQKAGRLTLGLTYATGTLVHLGATAAKACAGQVGWRDPAGYAALWAGLVAGGLGGALAFRLPDGLVFAFPAAAAALLALGCAKGSLQSASSPG